MAENFEHLTVEQMREALRLVADAPAEETVYQLRRRLCPSDAPTCPARIDVLATQIADNIYGPAGWDVAKTLKERLLEFAVEIKIAATEGEFR